jgi:hypothetical protein
MQPAARIKTSLAFLGLVILGAVLCWTFNWYGWLAVTVGAIGGLLHEFIQSKGKVTAWQYEGGTLDFGSMGGLILGGVAGFLAVSPYWIAGADLPSRHELLIEALVAGLALKGVAEAIKAPRPAPQAPPETAPQAPPETAPQVPPETAPQAPPESAPQAPPESAPQAPPPE